MSLESYNNFFNSVAESEGAAEGVFYYSGDSAGAAGTGDVEGVVENVQDLPWVGDENKNSEGYHYNGFKEAPKMTVDDVYGKSNQPRVENQGDYTASSNEKHNVDTSTFGKQNDITVTPASVTESKGTVNNSTIQSVEGLNFQQKDKASQDVLDSRKRRDEAEAEDKSNQMRDKIKAAVTNNESNEDVNDFQVGEEAANKEKTALDEAKNRLVKISNEYEAKLKEQDNLAKTAIEALNEVGAINDKYNKIEDNLIKNKASPGKVESVADEHMAKLIEAANKYGVDTSSLNTNQTYDVSMFITSSFENKVKALDSEIENLSKKQTEARKAFKEAEYAYNNAFGGAEEPVKVTTTVDEAPEETAITTAKDDINNSTNASEEEKADLDAVLKELEQASQYKNDITTKAQESDDKLNITKAAYESAEDTVKSEEDRVNESRKEMQKVNKRLDFINTMSFDEQREDALLNLAKQYGVEANGVGGMLYDNVSSAVLYKCKENISAAEEALDTAKKQRDLFKIQYEKAIKENRDLWSKSDESDKYFEDLRTRYNDTINALGGAEEPVKVTTASEETPIETSIAETAITTAKDAINNSTNASEEEKAAANEALDNVKASKDKVSEAALKLTESLDNVSDADIDAYMKAIKELNKNYEDANDKVSFFKRTDFNKQYVTAIAKANDFDVTLADGSKMSFSEFSTKMATKSPRIAKAMYNAKADRLEKEGHPVLAKIERNKAKMVGNWFGSKFTFADDLVRNQFHQMAETNMRATYAACDNVLNDPNATPEQKAEASASIDQANSLMTASAALKASTGFWSGIGDGMGDGTYGTTNPGDLNTYQKTLNKIENYTKIVLGLGITPGANRAYENMYYLAGKDVDKSVLFNKDFDGDGFAFCQEYGNSATAGMFVGAGELSTGVALMFNPFTAGMGANLIGDAIGTLLEASYGVAINVNKSEDYISEVLDFFEEAKDIAEKSINVDAGNEEVVNKITSAISQIENFRLGSEEANSFDNWLEGSGSNTTDGGKFNQALTYEEWLKLIEADPTMQEYAKKLIAEKKNAKESNADAGVNS